MLKAGKREGLLDIFIHSLAVIKGLRMSQSFFKACRKRDSKGEETHEGDVCFHQEALLFYNGHKCISSVILLTVKKTWGIQLNRKDTLERCTGVACQASARGFSSGSASAPDTSTAGSLLKCHPRPAWCSHHRTAELCLNSVLPPRLSSAKGEA